VLSAVSSGLSPLALFAGPSFSLCIPFLLLRRGALIL